MNKKLLLLLCIILCSVNAEAQRTYKDYFAETGNDTCVCYIDSMSKAEMDFYEAHPRLDLIEYELKPVPLFPIEDDSESVPAPSYFSYNYLVPPKEHAISKSMSVGEIPCSGTVSETGVANVTVPIEVYRGADDFNPQLSFCYNSNAAYGTMGYGWMVAGLSVIMRTPRNMYFDGYVSGVHENKKDAFVLDGVRLVAEKDKDGKRYYRTSTGNIRVIASVKANDVDNFTVMYPNGTKSVYGIHDSCAFYVTRVIDKHGHEIRYSYEEHGNRYRVKDISYGRQFDYKVCFEYDEYAKGGFPKAHIYYVNGTMQKYDDLLVAVSAYYGDTKLRTYRIFYMVNNMDYKVSIIECQTESKKLNPLYFCYNDAGTPALISSQMTTLENFRFKDPSLMSFSVGKFEYGNENDGIIAFRNLRPYVGTTCSDTKSEDRYQLGAADNCIINQYHAGDEVLVYTGISDPYSSVRLRTTVGEGFVDMFSVDIDDVAGDEVVKVNNICRKEGNKYIDDLQFTVYSSSALQLNLQERYRKSYTLADVVDKEYNSDRKYDLSKSYSHNLVPKSIFTGDFNGDGKKEILIVTANSLLGKTVGTRCAIVDLENDEVPYNEVAPFIYEYIVDSKVKINKAFNLTDKIIPYDYDGDGKTDIVIVKDDATYFYSFSISDGVWKCVCTGKDEGLKKSLLADRNYMLGDFNGDGRLDILVSPVVNGSEDDWNIYAGTGMEHFARHNIHLIKNASQDNVFFAYDVNRDGQTDLVVRNKSKVTVYFLSNFAVKNRCTVDVPEKSAVIPACINSKDGTYSILAIHNSGSSINRIEVKNDVFRSGLMNGFVNSLGVATHFGYAYQNVDKSEWYDATYGVRFPYVQVKSNMLVCDNMKTYYKGKLHGDIHYTFKNGIAHKQGLGFCGFERVSVKDSVTKEWSDKYYNPYEFANLEKNENISGTYTYEYDVNVGTDMVVKNNLQTKTFLDKTNGVTSTTKYTYDSDGNMTTADATTGLLNSSKIERKYVDRIETDSLYILGLISEEINTKKIPGSTYKDSVRNVYDSNYDVRTIFKCVNGNLLSTETFEYYPDGSVASTTESKYASEKKFKNSFEYYPDGMLKSHTDQYGFKETYNYNKSGLPESSTDHLGNTVRTSYDEWGHETKKDYADGSYETVESTWSDGEYGSVLVVTKFSSVNPATKTYYDVWGNVVCSGEKCFDNTYLWTEVRYDDRKRAVASSYPYKSQADKWITTTYDDYNRVTKVEYPTGKYETYTYKGNKITAVKDGISVTKTYNNIGKLVRLDDQSGYVTYSYNADGSLKQVTAPGNVQTKIFYDKYGRRTKLIDPSAGTILTEYDKDGNVSKSTDARKKQTVYTYDKYNRMIRKEFVGECYQTYTYSDDNHLVCDSNSNGYVRAYSYDKLGRLTASSVTGLDGHEFERRYIYSDSDGRLSNVEYYNENGFIASEKYGYSCGTMTSVKLYNALRISGDRISGDNAQQVILDIFNPRNVYSRVSEDDMGREKEYRTGAIRNVRSFDDNGNISSLTSYCGNSVLQNFAYEYDNNTDNMVLRTDVKRNLSETLEYDGMNRLVKFGENEINYAPNGNIRNNSLVGKYHYDEGKPYAVSEINNIDAYMPHLAQYLKFNAQERVTEIKEGNVCADFVYDAEGDRIRMIQNDIASSNSVSSFAKYYFADQYEVKESAFGVKEMLYIGGDAYDAPAVYVHTSNDDKWKLYYILRDHQGSIMSVVDENGNVLQEMSYDAWGNLRNPDTWELYGDDAPELMLDRGYTGHEHLPSFGLINMNARLYNPLLGRFISPDPYVQAPDFTQNFNRFSYCLNNPLKYYDKSGKFAITTAIIVGAVIGAYSGGVLANGSFNPTKWNYSSATTWKYMFCGALTGAFSGGVGAVISNSGVICANTLGIMASSTLNSYGTYCYTGGKTPISISFGAFSYDFTNGEFGYLGKKGNSTLDNIGYGLGAFANVADMGKIGDLLLNTEKKDAVNHSAIKDLNQKTIISIGPGKNWIQPKGCVDHYLNRFLGGSGATNEYPIHGTDMPIKHVNTSIIKYYGKILDSLTQRGNGILPYSFLYSSCSTHTGLALNFAGIPTLFIHPYAVQASVWLWNQGITPSLINNSYHLQNELH